MVWPWLAAFTLSLGWVVLPADLVQKAWAAPLWTSMTIPVGVLMLLTRLGTLTLPEILTSSGLTRHTKLLSP